MSELILAGRQQYMHPQKMPSFGQTMIGQIPAVGQPCRETARHAPQRTTTT
jgi:hypothetical protein